MTRLLSGRDSNRNGDVCARRREQAPSRASASRTSLDVLDRAIVQHGPVRAARSPPTRPARTPARQRSSDLQRRSSATQGGEPDRDDRSARSGRRSGERARGRGVELSSGSAPKPTSVSDAPSTSSDSRTAPRHREPSPAAAVRRERFARRRPATNSPCLNVFFGLMPRSSKCARRRRKRVSRSARARESRRRVARHDQPTEELRETDHRLRVRTTFDVVAVEHPRRGAAVQHPREFPRQVRRIAQPRDETLPGKRRRDVRGIAGEKHTTLAEAPAQRA